MPLFPSSRRQLLRALVLGSLATPLSLPARAAENAPPLPHQETLADLIPADFDWDTGERGALLVIDPAGTRRSKTGTVALSRNGIGTTLHFLRALPAFDRKTATFGALTVVAPTTMIRIADDPPHVPRLWEGLRRDERTQYLMSTFTPAQWEKCGSSEGLGTADLTDADSRAAFLSLLPNPMIVSEGIVDNGGFLQNPKKRTLTDQERNEIRLRVRVTTGFYIPATTGRGESMLPTALFRGMPGDKAVIREDARDFDRKEAYGAEMAQEVPNRPKPSHLEYTSDTRLARSVDLTGAKTISALCQRASVATGIELRPDFRVAGLPIYTVGRSVRASDLLAALALAVCGTWRCIGESNTFMLVADLTGAGARRLRLSDWYADLDAKKYKQLAEWRQKITRDGTFQKYIGTAQDDPLGASGDLAARIKTAEAPGSRDADRYLKRSDLTPEMQEYLRQMDEMYRAEENKWDRIRVHPHREVAGQFVLPDGTPLVADTGLVLGPAWSFEPASERQGGAAEAQSTYKIKLDGPFTMPRDIAENLPLALTAITLEEARSAVALARRHGFSQLWLKTNDAAVLAAAATAASSTPSIHLQGITDVFTATDDAPTSEQDRNLLGETGPIAAKARFSTDRWATAVDSRRNQFWPRPSPDTFLGPEATIPPSGAAFDKCIARLQAISAVTGLDGIVLTNIAPLGYAGKRSNSYEGSYDAPLSIRAEMGFTPAARLAFLRKEGVDPIDLIPDGLRFPADLRTPFFLDDHARGDASVYDGTQRVTAGFADKLAKWDAFRGERNHSALLRVRAAIEQAHPTLPVYTSFLPTILPNGGLPGFGPPRLLIDWSVEKLPAVERREEAPPANSSSAGTVVPVMVIAPPRSDEDSLGVGIFLSQLLRAGQDGLPAPSAPASPQRTTAIDLTTMGLEDTRKLLARWIKVANDAPTP